MNECYEKYYSPDADPFLFGCATDLISNDDAAIHIVGYVEKQGLFHFQFKEELSIADFINKAGGLKGLKNADAPQIVMLRSFSTNAAGRVTLDMVLKINSSNWTNHLSRINIDIRRFSVLEIPLPELWLWNRLRTCP